MRVLKRLQLLICILHIDSKVKSYNIRTKIIVWEVGSETTKAYSFDDYMTDGSDAHQAWMLFKKKILTDFSHLQLSMESSDCIFFISADILRFWLPGLSISRGPYELSLDRGILFFLIVALAMCETSSNFSFWSQNIPEKQNWVAEKSLN